MDKEVLAESLKDFIILNIDSVGQIEVLRLLVLHPDRPWTGAEVAQELRSNDTSATKHLNDLCGKGLISLEMHASGKQAYVFRPHVDKRTALAAELVRVYATYHLRIIHLVYNKPIERLRGFADAFKIRKEPSDG